MTTRRPVVAGQFYPRNAQELRKDVEQYLSDADVEPAPESVVAVVVPHAGYIFSAWTAGYAYARVRGKKPKRLIVMGCSHRDPVHTASVWEKGAFETPLGSFPIDQAFAGELAEQWESKSIDAHLPEHSIEVQLPFLEVAVGLVPIVPVLFGSPATQWHAEAGAKLAKMVDEIGETMKSGTNPQKKHLLQRVVKKVLVHDRRTVEVWYGLPDSPSVRTPGYLAPRV